MYGDIIQHGVLIQGTSSGKSLKMLSRFVLNLMVSSRTGRSATLVAKLAIIKLMAGAGASSSAGRILTGIPAVGGLLAARCAQEEIVSMPFHKGKDDIIQEASTW